MDVLVIVILVAGHHSTRTSTPGQLQQLNAKNHQMARQHISDVATTSSTCIGLIMLTTTTASKTPSQKHQKQHSQAQSYKLFEIWSMKVAAPNPVPTRLPLTSSTCTWLELLITAATRIPRQDCLPITCIVQPHASRPTPHKSHFPNTNLNQTTPHL
jgi:hypothetical protein